MITRLMLLDDAETRHYRPPQDAEMGVVVLPVLVFVIAMVVLPLVWKFVLLFVVIIVGGYFLNKAVEQKPEPERAVIELAADSITLMYTDKDDIQIELSNVALLVVWSDYYPGFTYMGSSRSARTSDGHVQLTIKMKDGSEIIKQCLIRDQLQYRATITVLKVWYSKGIAINESVTFDKYMGFLMQQQSTYTFAELQAAKAELSIS